MKSILFAGACMGALLFATPAFANAAPPPPAAPAENEMMKPDAFIQKLYQSKMDAEKVSGEFGAAQTDSIVLSDFTPELLALYKTAIDIDEPIVDGDAFWDSQEYEVKKVDVKVVKADANTPTVEADFEVMPGEMRQVTYALKKNGDRWQIDDITGAGGSMRKWLAEGIKGAGK